MSLFGSSPDESPGFKSNNLRSSLFEDEPPMTRSSTSALFADDEPGADSPWAMPTPRRQQTRADLIRNLIPPSEVPDSYVEAFDGIVAEDGSGGRVTSAGVARTLAAAKLGADEQARVMSIIAPRGEEGDISLDRNQFNVFLALIALAQEGEIVSLDGVDERRRNLPQPKLHGLVNSTPALPHLDELAAKPPQRPTTPPQADKHFSSPRQRRSPRKLSMEYPEDPWNTPDLHKNHNHPPELPRPSTSETHSSPGTTNGNNHPFGTSPQTTLPIRPASAFPTNTPPAGPVSGAETAGDWGFFDGNPPPGGILGGQALNPTAGFGSGGLAQEQGSGQPSGLAANRTIGGGQTGAVTGEEIKVTLVPEKQGSIFDRHHVFEITSSRRGSKVIRRYKDFDWLLSSCLHRRYPFRALPLLPPKTYPIESNHYSRGEAFLDDRCRGLARFLNALVQHPVLSQDQLVIMFLTVPTELGTWSKQAAASVQDEFTGRALPPGLEDSLPPSLEDLFSRTRAGVERSAALYVAVCDKLSELVACSRHAAQLHGTIAKSLATLTEVSADTYATDTNDVPLLNDGLQAVSRHLNTAQSLMEDETRAWDRGVLEDLYRQRDALVSLSRLFKRRKKLDKDNIPYLEARIASNEAKLAALRAKPEGMVKPGEMEKVIEAIIKDKESIVNQHNRSIFVKEALRDELIHFQRTQYNVTQWSQDWAQDLVKYTELLAENWRRLLDGLEGMPHGD